MASASSWSAIYDRIFRSFSISMASRRACFSSISQNPITRPKWGQTGFWGAKSLEILGQTPPQPHRSEAQADAGRDVDGRQARRPSLRQPLRLMAKGAEGREAPQEARNDESQPIGLRFHARHHHPDQEAAQDVDQEGRPGERQGPLLHQEGEAVADHRPHEPAGARQYQPG